MTETMATYLGDRPVLVQVKRLECGAGQITCLECGGDGDWKKFVANNPALMDALCPNGEPLPCIECKGTGRVLVSV